MLDPQIYDHKLFINICNFEYFIQLIIFSKPNDL